MSSETTEIRPKRRKEERSDEILAAALTVFTKDGFSGARLEEIAERAGCTKGTIYVYFESKEDLFKAVVRRLIVPSFRKVDEVLNDSSLDTVTRLRLFVTGAYREIVEGQLNMAMLRLLIADGLKFPELVDFYHQEVGSVGYDLMKATLERGVERGEIRPIATEEAAHIIFGPIIAESMRRLLGSQRIRPTDIDALIEIHIDILLNGLLPRNAKRAKV